MENVRIGRASFNSSGNDDAVVRMSSGQQPFASTYDAKQGDPVRYQPTDRSSATVGPVYPASQKPISTKPDGVTALLDPASVLSALFTPRLRPSLGCLGRAPGLLADPSSGPSSSARSANTFSLLK